MRRPVPLESLKTFLCQALVGRAPRGRRLLFWLGATVGCIVLACDLWLLVRINAHETETSVDAHGPHTALETNLAKTQKASQEIGATNFDARVPVSEADYLPDVQRHRVETPKSAPTFSSVKEAAARSCSTSSVDGLSRQIIAQSRCIDPDAFAKVPDRPNLSKRPHVFLYLSAPARDHLLAALDKNRSQTLVISSALRTVAQQYLLSRWGADQRCGIQLAARPGASNHESGLALDIAEPQKFRSALEKHGFTWLGKKDRVHFDYTGRGAAAQNAVDVKAFQQLWNRNHPEDTIAASGRYGSQTERRLAKSPAAGFAKGAHCSG